MTDRRRRGLRNVRLKSKTAIKTDASSDRIQSRSKQQIVIALLKRPSGATIHAIARAVRWQPHTIRAFFTKTIRRKLKLDLAFELRRQKRYYRIGTSR